MGKKVLIFKGSSRKKGFTQQLIDEVVKGVQECGGEPVLYELSSKEITPCKGCEYCYTHAGCSIKDYLTPMYEQMEEGASFLMASPLYWASISGTTKVWLDRMHPILDGVHWGIRWPNVKYATMYVSGNLEDDPLAVEAVDWTERVLQTLGIEQLGTMWVKYTDRERFALSDEDKKNAYELGKKLAAE